jgi:hypothetical protein
LLCFYDRDGDMFIMGGYKVGWISGLGGMGAVMVSGNGMDGVLGGHLMIDRIYEIG